jgi:hypothetical protein
MPLVSSVGPYSLDLGIDGLQGLCEFSDAEYLAIPKFFAEEKIYTAPDIDFVGFRWSRAIAAPNGRIYKISPQLLTNDSDEATRAFVATNEHFVDAMGEPAERAAQGFFWRIPPGNVILEEVRHLDVHCDQIFITGGEYFVRTTFPTVQKVPPSASSGVRLLAYLYILSLLIAAPYYNWQYAREHSFSDWFVWGEIVSTPKAFAWPYFITQSDQRGDQVRPS